MPLLHDDLQMQAIRIVKDEITQWETASAFVTEKVAFQMRNLIRQLRKNYWGVFDVPVDKNTGRKRIWVPLSESIVDTVVKNSDLDTKDLNTKAKKPEARGLTSIVRSAAFNDLDRINFGEDLNLLVRQLSIDGTVVWKTFEEKDDDGKPRVKVKIVDLLNWYIDPTADDLQKTNVVERSIMSIDEFKNMTEWVNTENIKGQSNVQRIDGEFNISNSASTLEGKKFVEVFEFWGQIPECIITGKEDDKDRIEGRIIASRNGSAWAFHFAEKNVKKIKPYEAVMYTKVHGRWYGKGPVEKVMMLQQWMNTIVNIRINRSFVSQLGIFKVRRNSGVTAAMLSKLSANGAITVNSMDDIEQMAMQEASQASYIDEDRIQNWAERVTSAFETVTGEQLPSQTTATEVAITSKAAMSQFGLVKQNIGLFLERWMKNQFMPILAKRLKADEIIQLTGDPEDLRELDELVANKLVADEVKRLEESGVHVSPEDIERERIRAVERLNAMGEQKFTKLKESINLSEYEFKWYVTNESIDKGVLLQNLQFILQTNPELRDEIVQQIYDVLNLGPFKAPKQIPQNIPDLQQNMPVQNPQEVLTQAVTI